ncbi:MAG: hypothetical protein ACK5UY_07760 [Holosporales bacterium]
MSIKQLIVKALGALQIGVNGLLPATAAPVSTNPIEPDAFTGEECAAVIIKDDGSHAQRMRRTIAEELFESNLTNKNVHIYQTNKQDYSFVEEKNLIKKYQDQKIPVIMNLSYALTSTMPKIREKYVAQKSTLQEDVTKRLEEKYGSDLNRLTLFKLERDPLALWVVDKIFNAKEKAPLRQILKNPYVTAYIAAGNGINNKGLTPGDMPVNILGLGVPGIVVVGSDPQGLTNKAGSVMPTFGFTKIMTPIFRGFSGPYYDGRKPYLMVDYNGDGQKSTKMPISPAEAEVIEQYSGQNIHAIKAAGNFISLEEYQRQHNNPSHLPKDRHQEWLEKVTANAVVGTEYPSIFQVFIKTDDGRRCCITPLFKKCSVGCRVIAAPWG